MSKHRLPFRIWLLSLALDVLVSLWFAGSIFFGILSALDGSSPARTAALFATAAFILAIVLMEKD